MCVLGGLFCTLVKLTGSHLVLTENGKCECTSFLKETCEMAVSDFSGGFRLFPSGSVVLIIVSVRPGRCLCFLLLLASSTSFLLLFGVFLSFLGPTFGARGDVILAGLGVNPRFPVARGRILTRVKVW